MPLKSERGGIALAGQESYSYDRVPYQSLPFAQSHPDRLAVIATLFGMDPQPIDRCRVLELGCASGGNLIPMAEMFPESLFLGVDLSERQLAEGWAIIERLGLENIRLLRCDIRDVGPEMGTFDYIIAHGVYSWVPVEVRRKIMQICRDLLEPNGVAYISYNTYPGWHMRGMIRNMLIYHTRQFGEPQERVDQARALLKFLAESVNNEKAYGAYLKEELELFSRLQDHYLYHEHLEDVNQPIYFHEFVELAESHGLQFLGEADFHMMAYWNFDPEIDETLQRLSKDLIQIEQYMDFLRNRTFRQTLLCHRYHVLERTLNAKCMNHLYVASPLAPEQSDMDIANQDFIRFVQENTQITTTRPLIKAAHMELYRVWPASIDFRTLLQGVHELIYHDKLDDSLLANKSFHFLGEHLIRCYAAGAIELHTMPAQFITTVSECPAVSSLVRLQAESGNLVTNRKHEYVTLNTIGRHIVRHLDSTQNQEAVLARLHELIGQGEISLQSESGIVNESQAGAILSSVLTHTLKQFCNLALLVK